MINGPQYKSQSSGPSQHESLMVSKAYSIAKRGHSMNGHEEEEKGWNLACIVF